MNDTWFSLILIALLIMLNAFLNLAEISTVSVRRARIKQLAEEGNPAAMRVQRLLDNPRTFIATVQVGVTLAGFFASAEGAISLVNAARLWLQGPPFGLTPATSDGLAFVLITVAVAFVTLIFGELVPKTFAIERAEPIALRLSAIITVMSRVTWPVIAFLTGTTNLVLRLLGAREKAHISPVTEEEIIAMIETGEDEGVVTASEQEMIRNIFDFTDSRVSDVMVPRPDMFELPANMTIAEAGPRIRKSGYSRIPLFQDDRENITGIVFAKDVLGAYIDGRTSRPLQEIARPVAFVPETKRIDELRHELQRSRQNMAIAVDEFGGVSGMLTLEDLLEEIVGDIQDEFQHEEAALQRVAPGELLVAGNLPLQDVVEAFDLRIRDSSVENLTVAGLILEEEGRIPDPGDRVAWHDLVFTVIEMDRRRISKVRVKLESAGAAQPAATGAGDRVAQAP